VSDTKIMRAAATPEACRRGLRRGRNGRVNPFSECYSPPVPLPALEAGGVLTAIALLLPWTAWLGWAAAVLLGAGPFLGYLASRSVGLPGDPRDVGNWDYWTGSG
jgi:hypothetical protein